MPHDNYLIDALQAAGLRITSQRLEIYRLLSQTDQHPTAQMIHAQLQPVFPSLSLATVYNTLETMVSLGVINALGPAGDGAMHYDADTTPHVNLACTSCHHIMNLPGKHVRALEEETIVSSGYHITGARVMYYGLCPNCQ